MSKIMRMTDQLALVEEFERSAESRRRKAVQAYEADEHRLDDHRREEARREEEEDRRFEETMLATSEQVARFEDKLDHYDTAIVDALIDNRQALDQAENTLEDIHHRAFVMHDGRRAYKTEDGQQVFDETGSRLGRDVIDPSEISAGAPTWERVRQASENVQLLTAQRDHLLEFQHRVDQAHEQARNGDLTRADLQSLGDDLSREMPEAVRRKLGAPGQEAKPDDLLSGEGFNPNSVRPAAGQANAGRIAVPSLTQ